MRITLLLLVLFKGSAAMAWGFFAHGKINELAVYTVPKPLFGFYKQYAEWLSAHAADPDKRRYVSEDEACRHYLDGDRYEHALPLDTIPRDYRVACAVYTEDTVKAHGIVPWYIQTVMYRLTEAFRLRDTDKILRLSADLGHYVGDLHVPLHAHSNYNGQKTGQKGIHGFWESRLPELFYESYDLLTGVGAYYQSPADSCWAAYGQSFFLADSVLRSERRLSASFPDERKYAWESRGSGSVRVYSMAYSGAWNDIVGDMVEERMRASVRMLGSLWYTCWVNAGQPDLENMPPPADQDAGEELPPAAVPLRDEE